MAEQRGRRARRGQCNNPIAAAGDFIGTALGNLGRLWRWRQRKERGNAQGGVAQRSAAARAQATDGAAGGAGTSAAAAAECAGEGGVVRQCGGAVGAAVHDDPRGSSRGVQLTDDISGSSTLKIVPAAPEPIHSAHATIATSGDASIDTQRQRPLQRPQVPAAAATTAAIRQRSSSPTVRHRVADGSTLPAAVDARTAAIACGGVSAVSQPVAPPAGIAAAAATASASAGGSAHDPASKPCVQRTPPASTVAAEPSRIGTGTSGTRGAAAVAEGGGDGHGKSSTHAVQHLCTQPSATPEPSCDSSGVDGSSGVNGSSDVNGSSGASCSSGVHGNSGTSGSSSVISSTSSATGTSGSSGASNSSGMSGSSSINSSSGGGSSSTANISSSAGVSGSSSGSSGGGSSSSAGVTSSSRAISSSAASGSSHIAGAGRNAQGASCNGATQRALPLPCTSPEPPTTTSGANSSITYKTSAQLMPPPSSFIAPATNSGIGRSTSGSSVTAVASTSALIASNATAAQITSPPAGPTPSGDGVTLAVPSSKPAPLPERAAAQPNPFFTALNGMVSGVRNGAANVLSDAARRIDAMATGFTEQHRSAQAQQAADGGSETLLRADRAARTLISSSSGSSASGSSGTGSGYGSSGISGACGTGVAINSGSRTACWGENDASERMGAAMSLLEQGAAPPALAHHSYGAAQRRPDLPLEVLFALQQAEVAGSKLKTAGSDRIGAVDTSLNLLFELVDEGAAEGAADASAAAAHALRAAAAVEAIVKATGRGAEPLAAADSTLLRTLPYVTSAFMEPMQEPMRSVDTIPVTATAPVQGHATMLGHHCGRAFNYAVASRQLQVAAAEPAANVIPAAAAAAAPVTAAAAAAAVAAAAQAAATPPDTPHSTPAADGGSAASNKPKKKKKKKKKKRPGQGGAAAAQSPASSTSAAFEALFTDAATEEASAASAEGAAGALPRAAFGAAATSASSAACNSPVFSASATTAAAAAELTTADSEPGVSGQGAYTGAFTGAAAAAADAAAGAAATTTAGLVCSGAVTLGHQLAAPAATPSSRYTKEQRQPYLDASRAYLSAAAEQPQWTRLELPGYDASAPRVVRDADARLQEEFVRFSAALAARYRSIEACLEGVLQRLVPLSTLDKVFAVRDLRDGGPASVLAFNHLQSVPGVDALSRSVQAALRRLEHMASLTFGALTAWELVNERMVAKQVFNAAIEAAMNIKATDFPDAQPLISEREEQDLERWVGASMAAEAAATAAAEAAATALTAELDAEDAAQGQQQQRGSGSGIDMFGGPAVTASAAAAAAAATCSPAPSSPAAAAAAASTPVQLQRTRNWADVVVHRSSAGARGVRAAAPRHASFFAELAAADAADAQDAAAAAAAHDGSFDIGAQHMLAGADASEFPTVAAAAAAAAAAARGRDHFLAQRGFHRRSDSGGSGSSSGTARAREQRAADSGGRPSDDIMADYGDILRCDQVPEVLGHDCAECPACLAAWDQIIGRGAVLAVILPCGHAVCAPCLAGQHRAAFRAREDQRVEFACPLCRHELSRNLVKHILKDVLANDALTGSLLMLARRLQEQHACVKASKLVESLLLSSSFDIERVQDVLFNMLAYASRDPRADDLGTASKQAIYAGRSGPYFNFNARPELTDDQRARLLCEWEEKGVQLERAQSDAAANIFMQVNAAGRMDATVEVAGGGEDTAHVDLHGLSVEDARRIISEYVLPLFAVLPRVVLVTGRGLHAASGEATLREGVREYLTARGYDCRTVRGNPGALLVAARHRG
ncbi:hypothetical protein JKP88DRAFT_282252 [Tribonema minus]|uniref:RING-type domain-containing protein n=1 Tax=Tribonema minus TaxID=303371 RepID=A0A836C8Z3_9STRA|nr:hypothetical protein JKP88DRAFT_282252 [Tribonema minus]